LLWAMPLLDQLINFLIKCAQTWDVFVCDLYMLLPLGSTKRIYGWYMVIGQLPMLFSIFLTL
jgi:hypothetical protein